MNESRNRTGLIVGFLLIAAGALFFLERYLGLSSFDTLWPLLIVVLGVAFFVGMLLGGKQTAGLAIPGSIIVAVGLILLVQNWFDMYETWAYAWALILAAVGTGIAIAGIWSGDANRRRSGWGLARLGLLLFIIFGAFFEFIFHFSGVSQRGGQFIWPVLLMLVGILLLISRIFRMIMSRGEKLSWDQRDLFWPVILTGFGLLWFLVNQGWLPFEDISAVFGLWPILLVGAGLDLIVGRRFPWLGALMAAAVVGGVVWLAFNAERLQLDTRFKFDVGSIVGKGERVTGSGKVITESRDLSGYDGVYLSAGGVAEIIQGDTEGLTIEVDDNLLPYLDIQVSGGNLEIGVKSGYSLAPSQPIRYTIQVKDLREISVSGSSQMNMNSLSGNRLTIDSSGLGKFVLHNLTLDRLEINLSGSASVELDGTADQLTLDISGAGNLNAEKLQTRTARIGISGTGSAIVGVSETLDVEVSGAGSVSYIGSPSVTKSVSGAGSVRQVTP